MARIETPEDILSHGESTMPVVITDPRSDDNEITFVSQHFLNLTGYQEDEVVGRNCRFLQSPRCGKTALRQVSAAIQRETPFSIDLLNIKKDGSEFFNRLRIRPHYNAVGDLTCFVGVQTPIPAYAADPSIRFLPRLW